jgi:hypothetical protein
MKWHKVGNQKYEAVSVTGRTYVVSKASIYMWQLTADDNHVAVGLTAKALKEKALKEKAERDDVAHQKQVLK